MKGGDKMDDDILDSPMKEMETIPANKTYKEKLTYKKECAEKRLAEINEAISLIEEHPEVIKVMEAVGKVVRF